MSHSEEDRSKNPDDISHNAQIISQDEEKG